MNNERDLKSLHSFFTGLPYFALILDWIVYIFIDFEVLGFLSPVLSKLKNVHIYSDLNVLYSKCFVLILIVLASIGSRPKKKLNLNVLSSILLPVVFGLLMLFGSSLLYFMDPNDVPNNLSYLEIGYISATVSGAIILHIGLDNIKKLIRFSFMKDPFNYENESFEQPRNKVENEYSLNIPMEYYYKNRIRKGWFNLTRPFRGTIIIGTPDSGKSFSIIVPFIKSSIRKNFTMLLYDYKFPNLAEIAYYHYNLKLKNKNYNYDFHVVNLRDIEFSRRVNPLSRRYMNNLAACIETAETMVDSAMKSSTSGGNQQFFKQSAVNYLSTCLYFLVKYENGKYSTLPHLLALVNRSYKELFHLFSHDIELQSLISPFKTAFQNKAMDQLEGQMGTLKINLSRMSTPESNWVFLKDDVDLRISSQKKPSILVIASHIDTQNINANINSLLLNRITKLANRPDNKPCGIVVDELSTLYFHKVQDLIATGRENKIAVFLGLQEFPQLTEGYGKIIADTIKSVNGNIISGQARQKETLDWLERSIFGNIKQVKKGISITKDGTTTNINEDKGPMIPASKIADLKTGEVVAKLAFGLTKKNTRFENSNTYNCQIKIDVKAVESEKKKYTSTPKYYSFKSKEDKERLLLENMRNIVEEVDLIVANCTRIKEGLAS